MGFHQQNVPGDYGFLLTSGLGAAKKKQNFKKHPIIWALRIIDSPISMDWFVGENLNRKPSIFP
jgi:hypothetical protein